MSRSSNAEKLLDALQGTGLNVKELVSALKELGLAQEGSDDDEVDIVDSDDADDNLSSSLRGLNIGLFKLREYQQNLVEGCLAGSNSVVTLPTGTGKTEVAFAIAKKAKQKFPNKVIAFLCPNVVLVQQQADRYQRVLGSNVCRLTGGKAFLPNQDIFATPAAFRGHCRNGSIQFENLSLLVIDECHHAIMRKSSNNRAEETEHEYRYVLEEYHDAEAYKRPKLLGLTASPGEDEDEMLTLAEKFKGRLLCDQPDPTTVNTPKLVIHNIKNRDPELGELWNFILRKLSEKQKKYQRENTEIANRKVGQVNELNGYVRAIGFNPGFKDLERLYTKKSSEDDDEVEIFHELLLEVLGLSKRVMRSPFLDELVQLLSDTEGKKIVFVPTARVAICVAQTLTKHKVCVAKHLVGGSSDFSTDAANKLTIQKFNDGEYDCLVATSVLEEGIDVPDCTLVIRTEPPSTIISNIQARGRARYPQSSYVILVANDDEYRITLEMNSHDERLVAAARRVAADTAEQTDYSTSWNTPRPARRSGTQGGATRKVASKSTSAVAKTSFEDSINYVGLLNEYCQRNGLPTPTYKQIRAGGTAHQPIFKAVVEVNSKIFQSNADASNYKAAKKRAAYRACRKFKVIT